MIMIKIMKGISQLKRSYRIYMLRFGTPPLKDEFGHRWGEDTKCVLCMSTMYIGGDQKIWYQPEDKKTASTELWKCGQK